MTKRDIAIIISKRIGKRRINQTMAAEVVEDFFLVIFDALRAGKKVEIRNFGVFKVKLRKAKVGRNPKTGDVVSIPARNVVTFKPGKKMKQEIK